MSDRLDSDLKAWGAAQRSAAGDPPARLFHVAELTARQRTPRWIPLAAAAMVLVVGLGGYQLLDRGGTDRGAPPASSASPTPDASAVVPWADLPVDPADELRTEPVDPALPRCRTADLDGKLAGHLDVVDGEFVIDTHVRNISDAPCRLEGTPTRLRGKSEGEEVALTVRRSDAVQRRPVELPPGASAIAQLSWRGQCEPGERERPALTDVRVEIDGGALVLGDPDMDLSLRCLKDDVMRTNGMGVLPGEHVMGTPLDQLEVTMKLPSSVRAGDVLRYTVTLHDRSGEDVTLDPCPIFEQRVGVDVTKKSRLNCKQAPVVPAGGARTFAMEVPLPDDVYGGPLYVRWMTTMPHVMVADGFTMVDGPPRPTPDTVRCTPGATALPCGPGMKEGVEYPYELRTHCGIDTLYADGSYWSLAEGFEGYFGLDGPPLHFGDPVEIGTLVKTGPDVVDFRSPSGQVITYDRTSEDVGRTAGECN